MKCFGMEGRVWVHLFVSRVLESIAGMNHLRAILFDRVDLKDRSLLLSCIMRASFYAPTYCVLSVVWVLLYRCLL
jgi:hypothetical protein